MNIFYLSKNPKIAAKYHCDKHVVKMIVETAQLLSTAVHSLGVKDPLLYRETHKNHPSAIWTRKNRQQYVWTLDLLKALCAEYTVRYNKIHKTEEKISILENYTNMFPVGSWSDPPQCMPDDCKCSDTVQAYKNYYMMHKSSFAKWKTKIPVWFQPVTVTIEK